MKSEAKITQYKYIHLSILYGCWYCYLIERTMEIMCLIFYTQQDNKQIFYQV